MIVVGAVFLVLAALAVMAAVATGRDANVHLSGLGVDSTTTVLWIFCAGAATMLFLALAFGAFRRAARQARMRKRELKQLRAEESAAADSRAAHREADDSLSSGSGRGVDVRDGPHHDDEPSPATVGTVDDGRERRYVAGDDRN